MIRFLRRLFRISYGEQKQIEKDALTSLGQKLKKDAALLDEAQVGYLPVTETTGDVVREIGSQLLDNQAIDVDRVLADAQKRSKERHKARRNQLKNLKQYQGKNLPE